MTRASKPKLKTTKHAFSGLAVLAIISLAGCAGPAPESVVPVPSVSASAAPTIEFYPDGTAEENLPWFTEAAEKVFASEQKGKGQAYLDALTEAGFDPATMEVGRDLTTVYNETETLTFSVQWTSDSCLIGQAGASIPELVTAVMEPIGPDNRCLIGSTVQHPSDRS